LRIIPQEDYKSRLKRYTKRELKIMKVFAIFIPVQVSILAYIFFFMAFKISMFDVIQLAPVILFTDHPYGIKGYVLLCAYCFSLIMLTTGASLTVYKFLKKGEVTW
jgi:hypothetical protein